MEDDMSNEIVLSESVQLGAVQASSPQNVIERAKPVAVALAGIINDRKLYTVISGKKYVQVDGWATLGAMLGVLPREVKSEKTENGYEAYVELVRTTDGMVIGGASAICTRDERNWKSRDEYALKSMSATRATGKAYRLAFSWIMNLAGYESTPAEEMIVDVEVVKPKPQTAVAPKEIKTPMPIESAKSTETSDGRKYGELTNDELSERMIGISKKLNNKETLADEREKYLYKRDAILTIQAYRKA